jgi:hypothetical protein
LHFALCIILFGCSHYSASGSPYAHIRTVAVVPFSVDQKVVEYGLVDLVTGAVEDSLVADNTLRVVDQGKADALIRGTILEARDEPFTYTSQEEARQYRFRIEASVSYYDKQRQRTVWEKAIGGWGVYSASTGERERGRQAAAGMLAHEIIERVVGGW